jgi:hypothetical protein
MFSLEDVEKINTDVLIIGAGVAGMMAAAGAVRTGMVPSVVTKGTYASGSSSMARGGHSISIGHSDPNDNTEIFFEDAIKGSYGLGNPRLIKPWSPNRSIEPSNSMPGAWGWSSSKTAASNRSMAPIPTAMLGWSIVVG